MPAKKKTTKKAIPKNLAGLVKLISESSSAKDWAQATQNPIAANFLSVVHDTTKPPEARAELLLLASNEIGLDLKQPLAKLIERLDQVGGLCAGAGNAALGEGRHVEKPDVLCDVAGFVHRMLEPA